MKLISLSPFVSLVLSPMLAFSPMYAQAPAPGISASDAATAPDLQVRLVASDGSRTPAGSHTAKGFTVEVTDSAGSAVSDAAIAFRLPDTGPTGTFADGSHSTVAYTDASGHATISGIQWAATSGSVAMRVTATKGISHAGVLIEQTLTSAAASATPPVSAPSPVSKPAPTSAPPAPAQVATVKTIPKVSVQLPQGAPAAKSFAQQHAPAPQAQPSVSVSGASPGEAPHSSHAKWFIIAAIAAGAGAGVAMSMGHKGTTAAAAAPSLTIGSPSISVGAPH